MLKKINGTDLFLGVSLVALTAIALGGFGWLNAQKPLLSEGASSEIVSSSQASNSVTQLTLLGDTFAGYSTFRNREFLESLKGFGIELSYEDEFAQKQRAERLDKNADILVTSLDQFLAQKPNGRIVGLVDRTVGGDAVVLNSKKYPQLKSLLDLDKLVKQQKAKGKPLKIAYASDTPSEYLALVIDTKFDGFDLSNFERVEVGDASEVWELLHESESDIAVAVLWEPYVHYARTEGYPIVLFSGDVPTAIVDVIVASERLVESKPQVVEDFLEAYYRRIDSQLRNVSLLEEQIASDGQLSSTEAVSVVEGIEFFSSVEAYQWMNDGTLTKRLGATAAVLALSGQLQQIPDSFTNLYDKQFVEAAVKNTEKLMALVRDDNPELADKLSGKSSSEKDSTVSATTAEISEIGHLSLRGEVKFATESAILDASNQEILEALAEEIHEFNSQTVAIRVVGHTSTTGSADLNQKLSEKRAVAVVDFLRKKGLPHSIVASGKGGSEPLPSFAPTDPRQQRTVVLLVRRSN